MDVQPEIVVISLKRATQRRESIHKQLSQLGLEYAFFDAIDGREGHELFSRYDASRAGRIGEIPLTKGHLGCYASHYLIWQRCLTSGRPMIVLEDDAMIDAQPFLRFIRATSALPSEIECVRLFASKSRNKRYLVTFENGDVTVAKFLRGHKSSTGYYLRPAAAKKFLAYADRWAEPVDIEMDQFWNNGVECYGVVEPCLTNNPEFESAIDAGLDTS
ncbi:MAG: glycosyltransferase family 25 protein, partial [Gammaproteobacteria bacterium]|nr:glycosyltransferase family 25 protein [Gammaproteobacteria bacterium]